MRHRKAGVKLNRTTSHRQAMFRNMVTSLFKHDRIRTTDVKARELRKWADQMITLAKRGDLHARRQVLAVMREKDVVHKLFTEAKERFGHIHGGYTRIVKIGFRPGDSAPISLIELVAAQEKEKKGKKKAKSAPAPKAQPEGPEKAVETVGAPAAEVAAPKVEAPAAPETGEETAKKE
jgi:large subunit ribosomal protein L17